MATIADTLPEPDGFCACPGDCGCHSQGAPFFRPMYCGCRGHVIGHAGRLITRRLPRPAVME
jgi:hypothetical protein